MKKSTIKPSNFFLPRYNGYQPGHRAFICNITIATIILDVYNSETQEYIQKTVKRLWEEERVRNRRVIEKNKQLDVANNVEV